MVLQISLTELFVWFSVYLQRVLQSDIHVASYSYDAENEEWCEVSLQVIVAVLSINVYVSKIWFVFLWGSADELLAYCDRALLKTTNTMAPS